MEETINIVELNRNRIQSGNLFSSTASKESPQYNLVLTNNARYLEADNLFCRNESLAHVPSIKFDRTINRTLLFNTDVNENRFQMFRDPEIWTKTKRISQVSLSKGNKSVIIDSFYRNKSKSKVDNLLYNPKKEVTMEKTAIMIPNFELNDKNLDRSEFLNLCKEKRPESYNYTQAKDKLK